MSEQCLKRGCVCKLCLTREACWRFQKKCFKMDECAACFAFENYVSACAYLNDKGGLPAGDYVR